MTELGDEKFWAEAEETLKRFRKRFFWSCEPPKTKEEAEDFCRQLEGFDDLSARLLAKELRKGLREGE